MLIVGGGPIGILHAMLARMKGAEEHHSRRSLAGASRDGQAHGRRLVVDPREGNVSRGARRDTEAAATTWSSSRRRRRRHVAALDQAALRGRINWFAGLPKDRSTLAIDANIVHYRELRVTGTTACSTSDCRRAAELVNFGRLDVLPLVTRTRPLSEAPTEFATAKDHVSMKTVLIVWPG